MLSHLRAGKERKMNGIVFQIISKLAPIGTAQQPTVAALENPILKITPLKIKLKKSFKSIQISHINMVQFE